MDKFNVLYIIKSHFKTFNKGYCLNQNNKRRLYWFDFLIFFGIPLIIVLILNGLLGIVLTTAFYNALLTILSISVPLLLNLLVLMYDMSQNIKNSDVLYDNEKKKRLCIIRETTDNISFSILISLFTIIIIGLNLIFNVVNIYSLISSDIVLISLSWLILTVLMILKRTHLLISNS